MSGDPRPRQQFLDELTDRKTVEDAPADDLDWPFHAVKLEEPESCRSTVFKSEYYWAPMSFPSTATLTRPDGGPISSNVPNSRPLNRMVA